MSEPTAIEKEAGRIVEGACASLEARPAAATAKPRRSLFAEMPDEFCCSTWPTCSRPSPTPPRIKILFALMGGGHLSCDITAVVGCTQSAVRPPAALKQARLVKATRDGKNVITPSPTTTLPTMLRLRA